MSDVFTDGQFLSAIRRVLEHERKAALGYRADLLPRHYVGDAYRLLLAYSYAGRGVKALVTSELKQDLAELEVQPSAEGREK